MRNLRVSFGTRVSVLAHLPVLILPRGTLERISWHPGCYNTPAENCWLRVIFPTQLFRVIFPTQLFRNIAKGRFPISRDSGR